MIVIIYNTGEKPGVGTYKCTNCGQLETLDDATDKLTPCSSCNGTSWSK